MKLRSMRVSLLLIATVVFLSPTGRASSPAKTMAKVHYDQYSGPQVAWPTSPESIPFVKTSHGMPIYGKLPNRPYHVLGAMSDEGDMALKHVANAARLVGADALLVVGDKAFTEAGLKVSPELLDNAEIPDPRGPITIRRMDHPESLSTENQPPPTIRVTRIKAILIRWDLK